MAILVGIFWFLIAVAISVVVVSGAKLAVEHVIEHVTKNKDKVVHDAKMTVAIVICTLVFVLALLIPGAVRGEENEKLCWLKVRVNGSVEVMYFGKPAWFVVSTSNEGEIITFFYDKEMRKDEYAYVQVDDNYVVNDVSYYDPSHNIIWAPRFGGVLVIAEEKRRKKVKLQQRLVPDFFMTVARFQEGVTPTFAIDLMSNKVYVFVCMEDGTKALFVLPTLEKAISEVERIDKPAFVTCFVKKYGHQAVVYSNFKGHLEFWRGTAQSDRIKAALKDLQIVGTKVDGVQVVTTKPEPDPDDPEAFAPTPEEIADFKAMREAYGPCGKHLDF